jgi:outer membrane protein assembly factor BamB
MSATATAFQRSCAFLPLLGLLLLVSCGGGGSSPAPGSNATLQLSTLTVNVNAASGQPAPTANVQASISSSAATQTNYYLIAKFSSNGIFSVTDPEDDGNLFIQFKEPSALNVGTYNDTLTIEACVDQACTEQIKDSPQQVAVQYIVMAAAPVISALQPASTTAGGGPFTLTVTGSNFTSQSVVQWEGTSLVTTYVSPTELTALVPTTFITQAGTYQVTVEVGTSFSTPVNFTVQPLVIPSISQLSPASGTVGAPNFVLTVSGSNFTNQSVVNWGGSARTTTYVSPTQITAQINAADVASAATVAITVVTLTQTSTPVNFVVQPLPALMLGSVQPSTVDAGGPAFQLIVNGGGFTGGSVVLWNGSARTTTYVSTNVLQAQILAADIATAGSATVKVQNPAAQGGTTANGINVTIEQADKEAVAFQINTMHSGTMNFQTIGLPGASLWSVNVGGSPSFALIAAGLVFVTVTPTGSNNLTELVALNQTTGATVWGPVEISGVASAAYDAGTVFVVSSNGLMQAFDAGTGNLNWSATLPGQWAFSSGITALNGFVYTGGAGEGGTLYALSESTGALVWTQGVANGDDSIPAVTATGVYVVYPCQAYDFSPATGDSVWQYSGVCEGGGGWNAEVANGLLYEAGPTGGSDGFSGQTLNAATGAVVSTFVADNLPALGTSSGYFLQSGTLRGLQLSNNTVQWSFAGDGQLVTSPILVNNYVFVGSSSGNVYALNATSGAQVWVANVGASILASGSGGIPLYGLSAGQGLLVVPAGNTVTAYQLSTNP